MTGSTSSPSTRTPLSRGAVEELVTSHLPIVGYQVNEMLVRLPGHVLRDDLVSAGMAALAAAAAGYDPSTGVPFARYATLRIRGALLDELRGMDWAPRGARARARAVEGVEERLTVDLGRRPTRDELAAALGCSPADVDAAKNDVQRAVVSLDAFDGALSDVLPQRGIGPEEAVLQGEQVRYLKAAVHALPERLRVVVAGLYLEDRAVADLAAELGVTESRISQLRTEALGLMRDGMNASLEPSMVTAVERPGGVVDRRRQAYFAAVAAHASVAPTATAAAAADAVEPAMTTTAAPVPTQRRTGWTAFG
ncbi:sigma-70 family RNA polymerase sigma factor [Quadrisphaera sp. KR29]|uniref:sigma-70 family RNA polymerase sigma factor n=1 Tax=Quadrisphaera sp. KR29 TaxID=3461391 RepID=UPI0040443C0E